MSIISVKCPICGNNIGVILVNKERKEKTLHYVVDKHTGEAVCQNCVNKKIINRIKYSALTILFFIGFIYWFFF